MDTFYNKLNFIGHSDYSVTYKLNKQNGIFNWYPYTEGFSKPFVDKIISDFGITSEDLVMDPFSGSGTTALSCYLDGIDSLSIEVNPFMNFVGRTKIESLKLDPEYLRNQIEKIRIEFDTENFQNSDIPLFLRDKPFFLTENLEDAVKIKKIITRMPIPENVRNFFLLHLASILVKVSNMIRAADLRYRRHPSDRMDIISIFCEKNRNAINDLERYNSESQSNTFFFNEDICNIDRVNSPHKNKIDFFITSPPYLNGTNYDRNTKLEMGFLDFIKKDDDLRELRTKAITAGINSTRTKNRYNKPLEFIKPLVEKIRVNAYDKRIPKMVEGYFNDMNLAIHNISDFLSPDGKGVIVIGDSQYANVYIDTDVILSEICEMNGLKVEKIDVVRKRKSKNGMELRESIIFCEKII